MRLRSSKYTKKKKVQSWRIVVDGVVKVGRKDLESRHMTTKLHGSWVGRLQRALTLPSASQP